MVQFNPSINNQGALILGIAGTDGAGNILAPFAQQCVRTEAEDTVGGWSFLTDGTDGAIVCAIEPIPASNGVIIPNAQAGGIGYVATSAFSSDDTVAIIVRDPATQAPIDLSTTVVTVQFLAAGTAS